MKKTFISVGAIFSIAVLTASCAATGGGSTMSSAEMAMKNEQTTGVDMQGNVVELDGFTYGGDNQAAYADGKLATGAKDPSVCGSFSAAKCSVSHLK